MEMCERYLFLLMVNKFTVTRQRCFHGAAEADLQCSYTLYHPNRVSDCLLILLFNVSLFYKLPTFSMPMFICARKHLSHLYLIVCACRHSCVCLCLSI